MQRTVSYPHSINATIVQVVTSCLSGWYHSFRVYNGLLSPQQSAYHILVL